MTPLRQRMIEDMQIRNFSENTRASYRRVAYELGELCDEGFRRGYGTMLQSRELLQQSLSDLEPGTREKFVQKYPDAFISVQFVPAAPLRRRAQSVVTLYQWLLQSGPASGELDDTLLPAHFADTVARVRALHTSQTGARSSCCFMGSS